MPESPETQPGATPRVAREPVSVIDDDPTLRRLIRSWLEASGYAVQEYEGGVAALHEPLRSRVYFLDLSLGDAHGVDVLRHLRAQDPDVAVIVVTNRRDVETAVEVMRLGAFDYLAKPLDPARTLAALERAVARLDDAERLRRAREERAGAHVLGPIVGRSAAMTDVAEQVKRVLESDVTVCLLGESGVGKEVVARALHDLGRRRAGPFVAVNCAAIPAALQESELFGHEKGAFTGAAATHKGRFEQARGGTLFLDELGEMAPATQAALLRTLQEKTVRRVGGSAEVPLDVRVVCATHRDLDAEVTAGRFRNDLYYRLVVYPIEIPPLRARRDDIVPLVGHFLQKLRGDVGRDVQRISPDALEALWRYEWPGNVRELQNVVHRAMLACDGDEIALAHLPPAVRQRALPQRPEVSAASDPNEVVPLAELERRAINRALRVAEGNVARAARLLGISRATLYRRLAELGVNVEST